MHATQCRDIGKDPPSKVTSEQGPEGSERGSSAGIWGGGGAHSRHKE